MTRPLRVLLIGRHFWPHGSIDSANHLTELACAFQRAGVHVEVVTPRYASSWPEELMVREVSVHRPAAAPRSEWSMGRYVRHLSTWLRQHAGGFDVWMVDAIRDEAMAAIDAAKSHDIPVIVRAGGWGIESDAVWWQSSRSARKCLSTGKQADAVVAISAIHQRDLIAEGYSPDRVHRIEEGFVPLPPRSARARHLARAALARVNADLAAADDAPVLMCASRMTRDGGVNLLVRAAPHLIAKYPQLRIWFIGDGPYRDWIYENLRSEGVRASIAMPGSFCDHGDLYAAADLFLQPDESGLDYFLRSAIASELPIVSLDTPATRAVIDGGLRRSPSPTGAPSKQPESPYVQWVSGGTAKQIRLGLVEAFEHATTTQLMASELRRFVLRTRPWSESVQAYLKLMESLVRRRRPDHPSSMKAVS